jgi:SAM-dependent methyltransferase
MILGKTAQKIRILLKRIPLMQSIFYFLFRAFFTSVSARKFKFVHCPQCGRKTLIFYDSHNLRETGCCLLCTATTRYKAMAEIVKRITIIKQFYSDLNTVELEKLLNKIDLSRHSLINVVKSIQSKDFQIYEPSTLGAISNGLKKYSGFVNSDYFPIPDLKGGEFHKKIRFEDLQNLSFDDNFFDILLTQDVLEHVEKPDLAFKEIYRVLKPNGVHIFTVPIGEFKKTFSYFDNEGNLVQEKVEYHVDPLRFEGAKVFTQFGIDIIDIMKKYGFSSFFYYTSVNLNIGFLCKIQVIISIKDK